MNFLITGGAGTVGRDLTATLLAKGHKVRVLDKKPWSFPGVHVMRARLQDAPLVRQALDGIGAVIHLAWSFSDAPIELVEDDLKEHVALLDACVAAKVARLFYASTAVVYGKPLEVPVTEDSPCLVEQARKPFYAVAKLAAENFALAYCRTKELPVTVFRFWWSYGDKIAGRHLRDMLAAAQRGETLTVPGSAGGSFLDHEDLAHALLLAASDGRSSGQIFNLATVYLEWLDIARMITRVSASSSRVKVVPTPEWRGPQFLADRWELSTLKAQRLFGYRSAFSSSAARRKVEKAIAAYREELAQTTAAEAVVSPA